MRVRLEGKSLKGKNRVREHGELWDVLYVKPFKGKLSYYCQSLADTFKLGNTKVKDARWVECDNDPDFKVTKVEELAFTGLSI